MSILKTISFQKPVLSGSQLKWLIGALMVMYFIVHLVSTVRGLSRGYNSYNYTELLINFEGGFVRRGLVGQCLYELVRHTGWNPYDIITAVCFIAFGTVAVFMFAKVRKRNLNWWFLLTPFALGMTSFIIRKDYLTYMIIIGVMYLLREINLKSWKLVLSTVLLVFGLFVHEAFFFYGFPIAVLLVISSKSSKALYISCLAIVTFTFLVLCKFKGDQCTAYAIYESWKPLINEPEYVYTRANSIGAIGWDAFSTLKHHFALNFRSIHLGWYGLFFRPLFGLLIYYFIMNFLYVMHNDDRSFTESDRTIFSSLFLFAIVCLLPMFLFLSCDYGRIYQYATITTLSAFIILSRERLYNLFPSWWVRVVERFNSTINSIIVPSKGLMIVLMLMIAPSPVYFEVYSAIVNTVLFTDIHACQEVVAYIAHVII